MFIWILFGILALAIIITGGCSLIDYTLAGVAIVLTLFLFVLLAAALFKPKAKTTRKPKFVQANAAVVESKEQLELKEYLFEGSKGDTSAKQTISMDDPAKLVQAQKDLTDYVKKANIWLTNYSDKSTPDHNRILRGKMQDIKRDVLPAIQKRIDELTSAGSNGT